MLITMILGAVVFAASVWLSLVDLVGSFCKNVGTSASVAGDIFFLVGSGLFFGLQFIMYPDAWGLAYVFIVFNAGMLALQWLMLVGSAFFTKKHIYRLTNFLIFKRYDYEDVIGYVMKNTSGTVHGKYGSRKVISFEVEIYLRDDQYISFSTRNSSDKKIMHIKSLLKEHHCRPNGRIKKKPWLMR